MSRTPSNRERYEVAGLVGFILSGASFTISGLKSGDQWAVLGSMLWILACLIWLRPMMKK